MTTVTAADLAAASFSAMRAAQPAVLAYWYDGASTVTVRQFLDEISDTVGAYWGWNEARQLEVARYVGAAATPDITFTDRDLVRIRPLPVARRLKTFRVGYRRFWTVFGEQDMADDVLGADREAFKAQYRWTDPQTDATAAAAALLASEEELQSLFDDVTDATAERARRLALFAPKSRAFEISVELRPGLVAGQTARVISSRFGLTAGMNFVVMECEADARTDTHTLVLLGTVNG